MKIEVKKVKLSVLKPNPDNPRMISKKDMDRLVKSLSDFPEMLEIREIVCDETMTVLGGNMRLQALKKAGAKECNAKIVSGLTDEQKREFVIKDNGSWGEWSMDDLANAWGDLPLVEWGIDLPAHYLKTEQSGEKEPSLIAKNFMSDYGGGTDDNEKHECRGDGKYPVTFILEKSEWEQWEAIKEKMKIKQDKAAFLKLIGG